MNSLSLPDLDWLLRPLGVDEFVESYWQRRPVRLAASGREPQQLFDAADLEELIEIAQPKPPSIRLAAVGQPKLAVPELGSGRLDITEIRHAFLDGYTIIVNNVQRYHPPLQRLVETLQAATSFTIEANCYFTPPHAQGFTPHYDSHDVLVLQIQGRKQWHLYGESAARPLHQMVDGDPYDRGELPPPEQFMMDEGDVLYIPRGWVHEAETVGGTASLHVTLGVHASTGRDLLRAAVDAMSRRDPLFLAALPFGFLRPGAEPARVAEIFTDLVERLATEHPHDIASAFLHDQLIQRTEPTGSVGLFDLSERLDRVDDTTMIERNPTVPFRVVDTGDSIAVQFTSRLVNLPRRFRDAAGYLAELDGATRVGSIPGLESVDRIELVRQLVRDDLLCLVEPVAAGRLAAVAS